MTRSTPNSAQDAVEEANVLWFLPTHGDGRYLGTTYGARDVTLKYLTQVAKAADDCGYYGALLPTGRSCEDSWIVASALVPLTERLRYLVAVRPGLQSPAVAARMTATLDRISDGRLLINVVTGGDPVENKGDGIFLAHDERYVVTDEFLQVYTRLLAGETFDYEGTHIKGRGQQDPLSSCASPAPAALLRRLFAGRSGRRRATSAEISHMGESPRRRSPRKSRTCAASPRRRVAPCRLGSGST